MEEILKNGKSGVWKVNKYQESLHFLRNEDLTNIGNDKIELLYFHLDNIEELVDKATPIKPIIIPTDRNILIFECPKCRQRTHTNFPRDYCGECGQKLDWSEEE